MKFQIIKLIIWPKNRTFAPRIIKFEKGKVNVITGGSRTGKSAIIPIIDYCLASSECQIPIDTIRDHSEWYGLLFEAAQEQVLLARKGPEGREPSDAFFLSRGTTLSIPTFIVEPNEKTDSVKHMLNTISGTPYFSLNGPDDLRPYQQRLSFRDLMALIFQSQEVVANQNILFYKTHAHEHRERLKNWLPYILGAENLEVLSSRQRLSVIQTKLNQLRREIEKAKRVSESWLSNLTGHLQVAKTYGLLSEDYIPSNDPSDLLETAKYVLSSPPGRPQPTSPQIEQATKELLLLEEQDDKISDDISLTRKRLNDIGRLKSGLIGYSGSARRRADRLHISQWLEDISQESHDCPLCGSYEHDKTNAEISKITAAFKKIEDEANRTKEIPNSFTREEETLKLQLEDALSRRKILSGRIDRVLAQNKEAKALFDRRESMFFFLGHLKASLEVFQSLTTEGNFGEELAKLEFEEKELLRLLDPEGVQRRLQAALKIVTQKTLIRLQTLDAEDKYKKVPPEFSVKDLSLKVLSNDGHWHFLAEVGSASNWLSFHIAFICALHEFFNEMSSSCIPSFAVFDQPSQVYFPKTNRATTGEDKSQYADEDVEAVIGIFKTLANSVREQKGNWQCIVLDHARDEIYRDIKEVYEVEVWRYGDKLIPAHWYGQS
jgi:hypothetical protein